jgi:hypothetical protein
MTNKLPTQCPSCGGQLHPGKLHGSNEAVGYTPDFSSALVKFAIGSIPTTACFCKSCGLISLVGDVEHLRQKLSEA